MEKRRHKAVCCGVNVSLQSQMLLNNINKGTCSKGSFSKHLPSDYLQNDLWFFILFFRRVCVLPVKLLSAVKLYTCTTLRSLYTSKISIYIRKIIVIFCLLKSIYITLENRLFYLSNIKITVVAFVTRYAAFGSYNSLFYSNYTLLAKLRFFPPPMFLHCFLLPSFWFASHRIALSFSSSHCVWSWHVFCFVWLEMLWLWSLLSVDFETRS